MAITTCPECGQQVSTNAKTCPHCGCEITVCPDCNTAYANKPDVCANCGHVFDSSTAATDASKSEQTSDDEKTKIIKDNFKEYMQKRVSILHGISMSKGVLFFISFALLLGTLIIPPTIPKNDSLEYIRVISDFNGAGHPMMIIGSICLGIYLFMQYITYDDCNILQPFAAYEMTANGIDGASYCKELYDTLIHNKKTNGLWSFNIGTAYQQGVKSAQNYSIISIVLDAIFSIIICVCFSILTCQLFDVTLYNIVTSANLNPWQNLNITALIISIFSAVAQSISTVALLKKYRKGLYKWCSEKSLPTK